MSILSWIGVALLLYNAVVFIGGPILLSYTQERRTSRDTKERSEA